MGYRSEVSAIIYGDADVVRALLAAARLQGNKALDEFEDHIELKTNEHRLEIELNLSAVKWYSEIPNVKDWQLLTQEAEEMGLKYEFLRVGEDDTDVEHLYSDDNDQYHFYVTKTINRL